MNSKGATFRALHQQQLLLVMPNPWDAGTARILARVGFRALATSSAAMAFSHGLPDGATSQDDVLVHCKAIVEATQLPVSADLGRGFGDSPEEAAMTIRMAARIGLAGASLEDHSGDRERPIYDFGLAVERIAAAAEAARSLPEDFVLTARCENLEWGCGDLEDTIERLQAFEKAGADVLYAPRLRNLDEVRSVCKAIAKPVNVLVGTPGSRFDASKLQAAGVARVSTGSGLARLAFGAFVRAAGEIKALGNFDVFDDAMAFAELEEFFTDPAAFRPAPHRQ